MTKAIERTSKPGGTHPSRRRPRRDGQDEPKADTERTPSVHIDTATAINPSQWLTSREVEREYSLPLGTIYTWVHRHRIPFVRLGRRCLRFKRTDIEAWIASRRVEMEP